MPWYNQETYKCETPFPSVCAMVLILKICLAGSGYKNLVVPRMPVIALRLPIQERLRWPLLYRAWKNSRLIDIISEIFYISTKEFTFIQVYSDIKFTHILRY